MWEMSKEREQFPRQLVIPCQEHEAVSVPFSALLDSNGNLNVYEDVARSGYFDIDFRQGGLVVKATRFVGFIPLSDHVAIHVTPKAPIGNLLYMVSRAGTQTKGLSRFIRGYAEDSVAACDIEDVYASSFLAALSSLRRGGLLKRYVTKETDQQLRGRLLLTKSINRQYARGSKNSPIFELSEHTVDIDENRLLKGTAERLKGHFLARGGAKNIAIAKRLHEIVRLMVGVTSLTHIGPSAVRRIPILLRRLPASHAFYEPALWLSYLVAMGRSVKMEALGPARFETLIVDVSSVFEQYVRKLLLEARQQSFPEVEVVDGNEYPVPLFVTGITHKTHPDYYFRSKQTLVALADAKYKPEPSAQDRYEVLAFCEALGVQRAAIICPRVQPGPRVIHHGTTRAGRHISIVRIDLAAADLAKEEGDFTKAIAEILQLNLQ
jgi:5-methylcytosine-specific restriction endonuclease McrBC regulatory subunit McrC